MSAGSFSERIKRFFSKQFDKDLLYINTENGKTSVFALTFPIFFEFMAAQLIGIIQAIMAAHYEDGFFVIPLNTVNTVFGFFTAFSITASMGVTILLSAHLGKKDYDSAKKIVGNGVILSVIISVVLAIPGMVFAEDILKLIGMNRADYVKYLPYAVDYFRYRIIAFVAFGWNGVLTMALRCYGYSSIGFICTIISSSVTAILTFFSLFIIRIPVEKFCVAMFTVMLLSSFISLLVAVFIYYRKGFKISFKLEWKWLKSLLRVGVPSSVFQFAYNLSQILTTSICFVLNEEMLLAKLYASQILGFVFQFGYAMGKSNGIMVGRECGRGDFERAKKITAQNRKIVIICNFVISLVVALACRPLLKLFFDASENVAAIALPVFFIDVAVEAGRAFGHVGEGVLNATGDVMFMSVAALLSCWGFSVGLTYVFVNYTSLSVIGVWIAFAADEICRGVLFTLRWKSGKWRKSFDKKIAVSGGESV